MPKSLTALADQFGTDKGSVPGEWGVGHRYTEIYERFLSPRANEPLGILEIGVWKGASLRMWEEYFPNARIVGIDNRSESATVQTIRAKVAVGDATDAEFLKRVVDEYLERSVDIVVDDGGHTLEQQVSALESLFPLLNDGGLYFVEDVSASRFFSSGVIRLPFRDFLDYAAALTEYTTFFQNFESNSYHHLFDVRELESSDQTRLPKAGFWNRNLSAVHFFYNLCVFERGSRDLGVIEYDSAALEKIRPTRGNAFAYRELVDRLTELQSKLRAREDENARLAHAASSFELQLRAREEHNRRLAAEHIQLAAEHTQLAAENGALTAALVTAKSDRDAARAESEKIVAQAQRDADSIAIPLKQEVDQLWNSRSWRLLRPLRNLVRTLCGLDREHDPAPQSGTEALRTLITIRQSLSWELTAPLRVMHRGVASLRPARRTALRDSMLTANAFRPVPIDAGRFGSAEISNSPWNSVLLPKPAQDVMTMLSVAERRLLYYLGREYWCGDGAIVDCGCFVGGSTVALAEGVAAREHKAIGRPIHSYDRFRAERYMSDICFRPAGLAIKEGDSIRPLFDANTSSVAELLVVREGDITEIGWSDKPIEVFFIDLAKGWAINDFLLEKFFPYLIPKRSIVIQQDYVHEFCPWLHITMELLSPFFDFIAYVPEGSAVFRLSQKIPADFTRRNFVSGLPSADKLRLMDLAVSRWSGVQRAIVECAKAFLLGELEGSDSANAHLDLVERTFGALPRAMAATEFVRTWIRLGWVTLNPSQEGAPRSIP